MRSPHTLMHDLDIIAQRLRAELTAETVPAEEVSAHLARLAPDGRWPDIDYDDRSRTHWSPGQHVARTARLASAYAQSLFYADEGDALLAAIRSALALWVERDPQSDNWWYNCIHTPRHVGQILLLVGDNIAPAVWERAAAIVRRSGFSRTGANLTWEAGNLLVLACAAHDPDLLEQAVAALSREIRITTEEGIQPDWSFHQHGPQLYMSNYGEVFSAENSRFAVLLAGTAYALSEEQIRALSGLVREGQQWFIWGRQFDYHAQGRQLDSPRAADRAAGFAAICQRMALADLEHAQEYADLSERVTGIQAPGTTGPRGNRHYWRSDVMVHRPGGFYASVRMHSTRTYATEVRVNRENLKGYHLSDGVCYLMRRGDEYRDIQPVWDWRKLPGATCRDTTDPLPYGRDVPPQGTTDFVGGVSDGRVGVAAMDYGRDGVQARKAWFFMPDGWVALGAGIASASDDPVTTSINQCLLRSDVLLLRDGELEALAGMRLRGGDVRGVYHDGVGYYVLGAHDVVVRAAEQSGTWTSIEERSPDDRLITQHVFSLWIEHGRRPAGGGYAYRIVPGLDARGFATHPGRFPVTVVANDARLQAVASSGSALVQAVFYAPGRLTADDALSIEAEAPCALILRRQADAATLSIADPTQLLRRVQVRLSGRYAGPGCAYDRARESTLVTVDLPADAYAGRTIEVRLRVGPKSP
ncbi:MAG: hypothetical protein JXA09_12595 [Anaerolineae bacterium]|nr:hypothetical protein [Anaerolineae bacterium]